MSVLNPNDTGRVKSGNGVEFMRYQEKEAQRKNLDEIKG